MELESDGKFLFFTMMQGAIRLSDMGKNKKDFVFLAEEIWNSLEMNDKEELRETLAQMMLSDLQVFMK